MARRQHMPLFGEISEGPVAGWRFAFLRFVAIDGKLYLDLRCTHPHWCFPQDVRFSLRRDRFKLRAASDAPRVDALALMTKAMERGTAVIEE